MLAAIWDTRVEGKVRFFLWLLLQNRLWTGERLKVRGWPHNDRCTLCNASSENANHLMLTCPFAKSLWQMLTQSHRAVANIAHRSTTLSGWWKKIARFRKSKTKKELTTLSVYVLWHLWKERNRRIFENKICTPEGLLVQIRAYVANIGLAFTV
jgi:hypothetical protein